MKIFMLLIASLFIFHSCKNSTSTQTEAKDNSNDYKLRKKELEIKEKELYKNTVY